VVWGDDNVIWGDNVVWGETAIIELLDGALDTVTNLVGGLLGVSQPPSTVTAPVYVEPTPAPAPAPVTAPVTSLIKRLF
jgi:hypothetical protein